MYELLESILVDWIYVKGVESGSARSRNRSERRLRVVEDRNVTRYDFMYRTPQNALRMKGEMREKVFQKLTDDMEAEIEQLKLEANTGTITNETYDDLEQEVRQRYGMMRADKDEHFEREDRGYRRTDTSLFKYCLELGLFDVIRTGGRLRCKTNNNLDGVPLGKLSKFIQDLNNDRIPEEYIIIKDDVKDRFSR